MLPRHEILDAAQHGQADIVKRLLAQGASPNVREYETVERIPSMLLDEGEETVLQAGYSFSRTPLMLAARGGHVEIVDLLLASGADPKLKDAAGYSAFTMACQGGQLAVVDSLVRAGEDPKQRGPGKTTSLHLAVESGNLALLDTLLAAALKVNLKDNQGQTPLHLAAERGELAMMERLLQAGADVNIACRNHHTPLVTLLYALQRVEISPSQAQSGKYVSVQWTDRGIFAYVPLQEDTILPVVELLLQRGAEVDPPEVSPLACAAQYGRARILQRLLQLGADPNRHLPDGSTALEWARLFGNQDIVAILEPMTRVTPKKEPEEEESSRWGPPLAVPTFKVSPRFRSAVEKVASQLGPASIETIPEIPGGLQIVLPADYSGVVDLESLQGGLLGKGYFIFEPGGLSQSPHRLYVLPSDDPYHALAAMGTSGVNCGIGPGYLVEWLQGLEEIQPFVLLGIGHDLVAGRFLSPIVDPEGLAQEMYELCPDIVDQGTGTVEELAESLAESDSLFLWWD